MLAPALSPGRVVVLDNLAAHKKGERARRLIEAQGCELLFLPAYSPDLNPVEEAFSKRRSRSSAGEERRCAHPRSARGGDRAGAGGVQREGRAGLVRPLRLPGRGSTFMNTSIR